MTSGEATLAAARTWGWRLIFLGERSKRPVGAAWQTTQNTEFVSRHLSIGGNVGLVCCQESGVAVLDFDEPGVLEEMSHELGPLQPWVLSGRGFAHCYVLWERDLPARMTWRGRRVGEVQRGPNQYVVMPPSVHPDTGAIYRWLLNPALQPPPPLPEAWREYLRGADLPAYMTEGDRRGHPDEEPWLGPSPDELLARALGQPGARRRRNGVKFQCPGCAAEGHDRHRDNALVALDGRWGCAYAPGDPAHRRAIGVVLGAMITSVSAEVLGTDEEELRDVSIDDL